MKLHMNRKRRNNRMKLISLALTCCLMFSAGSSYASAGQMSHTDGGALSQPGLGTDPDPSEGDEDPIDTSQAQDPFDDRTSSEDGPIDVEGEESGNADQPVSDSAEIEYEITGDFDSLDQLTLAPNDKAYCFTRSPARREATTSDPGQELQWSFDAYYVNETDKYKVTKTDDFSLKYQMEFHTSSTFAQGTIKIRIGGALLSYRENGRKATPGDIGVPAARWDEEGNLVPNPSRSTSFNFYYENAQQTQASPVYGPDTPYLVFYNYRQIDAGTNAAWQVLYSNLKVMEIVDGTSWSLAPEVFLNGVGENDQNKPGKPFTGLVDTSVSLTEVVKTPYAEPGKKYTPGLYTLDQLERYVGDVAKISPEYKTADGRLNTEEYRFVVWDVKIRGNATQPWTLYIQDNPSAATESGNVTGSVVGYRDNSDSVTVYDFPINNITAPGSPNVRDEAAGSAGKKSWGHRFWVVTAYPADRVLPGDEVKNDITVVLDPQDGVDPPVILDATPASWSYRDYDWHYEGDVISAQKWNGWGSRDDNTEYTGWLEAYRRASQKEAKEDYGDIPFTVTGNMKGYGLTHHVEGSRLGQYKEGASYSLTTVDDFLYVIGSGIPRLMGKDDYYFSSVTVNQKDYGYDIYEDRLTDSERAGLVKDGRLETNFGSVKIFAMFAKDGQGKDAAGTLDNEADWEPVAEVSMDDKGNADFSFGPDQIKREPYRVKVEHESIDYSTECTIKLSVRLKAKSAQSGAMRDVLTDHSLYEKAPKIKLENLSGVIGIHKDGNTETIIYASEDLKAGAVLDGGVKSGVSYNYNGRLELAARTEALYGNLLIRDNAARTVTWLETTARANKKYSARNDAENNRVLVDYYLTAFDGYLIYDKSCMDYMSKAGEQLISPGRKHVVFYDLLPYGMQFDASTPVTAGRIRELDVRETYMENPGRWDDTQVSVTVNPSTDIKTNYKGTGRTLVAFHISYSGADPAVYTNGKWVEAWGVSFRAYYGWKNMDSVNKEANANLAAFMPDFGKGYIDQINRDNPRLYGLKSQVYADDGSAVKGDAKGIYGDLVDGGDIDGLFIDPSDKFEDTGICRYDKETADPAKDDWHRNVLYAETTVNDNVATASESTIEKLVRADSDLYGTFRERAVVEEGGSYAYEITVSAKGDSSIQGIAVFDRLEDATDNEKRWHGDFLGVDKSALEKQGISATVYYNDNRDAVIAESGQDPAKILQSNGWYERDEDDADTQWKANVRAVAVLFAPDYELRGGHFASFRIRMQAPGTAPEGLYAYNEASFSSYPAADYGSDTESDISEETKIAMINAARRTETGKSTRVGVSGPERLEIVKRTSGVVPVDFQDTEFSFRVYEKGEAGEEDAKLAFLAYDLYRADKNGAWMIQDSQPHATDKDGYLSLKANEKAVFHVADADRVAVEEMVSVFWEANPAPGEAAREERYSETIVETTDSATGEKTETITRASDPQGNIHVRTWINKFRPVLYVRKELFAVPQGMTPEETEFTFKLWVKKGADYVPAANAQFWYVDSVRTDGSQPARVNKDGDPWTGESGRGDPDKTGSDGTFTIESDQIIALFPGVAGTEYKLTEENLENGYFGDWYCSRPEATGILDTKGSSEIITNYYRWKDLDITKEITHQDPAECKQPFTFQIIELQLGEDGKPLTGDCKDVAATKKITDKDGTVTEVMTTEGLEWELLNADGVWEGLSDESSPTAGTLNGQGQFTCAFAGRKVRIHNLEAGKYYLVKEMPVAADATEHVVLYRPLKDSEEFKMFPFSAKKNLTFTNDYLKRPLTVKKAVTGDDKDETIADVAFEFTVTVNGRKLPFNTPYTVTRQGDIVRSGEIEDDGRFFLYDGESITFQDAGMLGQSFVVTEVDRKGYQQLYPADNGAEEGILRDEGGEAFFVNGAPNTIYIGKEYVTKEEADSSADKLIKEWKVKVMELGGSDADPYEDYAQECAVEFILEVTDGTETYIWPESDTVVYGTRQLDGYGEIPFKWRAGKSIKLPPWVVFSIPVGNGENEIPPTASYKLTEVESSGKRIIKSGKEDETEAAYVQVAQSYPPDGEAVRGTAANAPNATIVNNLTSLEFNGSKIGKRMTPASGRVPTGQSLTWKLEQYDGTKWNPADGIRYAVFQGGEHPLSAEVKTTGTDGRILLEKPEGSYPEVWFVSNQVYINLYDQTWIDGLYAATALGSDTQGPQVPLLRMVEVPEESGKEWGMLAGYGPEGGSFGWDFENYDPSALKACFYNSNTKASIEIEKCSAKRSNQMFTMILEQVVAIDGTVGEITAENYEKDKKILKSEPRGGIEYTICNVDGTPVEGRKKDVTGAGGEITLRAGQYVMLNVPDGTAWIVSEDTYAVQGYELERLEPESDCGKLVKLADNLMLINLPAPSTRYTLRFDANGGIGGPTAVAGESSTGSAAIAVPDETPVRTGYIFQGWSTAKGTQEATYQPGDTIVMSDKTTVTLCAVWKEQVYDYKLSYHGNGGEIGEPSKTSVTSSGNRYSAECKMRIMSQSELGLKREGYIFLGWSEEPDAEMPAYYPGGEIVFCHKTDGRTEKTLYAVWEEIAVMPTRIIGVIDFQSEIYRRAVARGNEEELVKSILENMQIILNVYATPPHVDRQLIWNHNDLLRELRDATHEYGVDEIGSWISFEGVIDSPANDSKWEMQLKISDKLSRDISRLTGYYGKVHFDVAAWKKRN